MENAANAHVCDGIHPSHRIGIWQVLAVPFDLLGRELFVLIVAGQSRPSDGKCIQLHAFLFRKVLKSCGNSGKNSMGFALVLRLKTRHFLGYKNRTISRKRL